MELSAKVTRNLSDISEKKRDEIEEGFQAKVGAHTPSQVCAALWKEANSYQTYHNQAVSWWMLAIWHRRSTLYLSFSLPLSPQSTSNAVLKEMFDRHYPYLLLLSGPLASLQATVPKMTPMDGKLCLWYLTALTNNHNYITVFIQLPRKICPPQRDGRSWW